MSVRSAMSVRERQVDGKERQDRGCLRIGRKIVWTDKRTYRIGSEYAKKGNEKAGQPVVRRKASAKTGESFSAKAEAAMGQLRATIIRESAPSRRANGTRRRLEHVLRQFEILTEPDDA